MYLGFVINYNMKGYNTHTPADRLAMLSSLGMSRIEDLFSAVPSKLILKDRLNLPAPHSEWSVKSAMLQKSSKNKTCQAFLNFIGFGCYEHFIPSVIDALISRGEFLTSYTPYQPEMSQGLLQALYEYQLVMSKVTGHETVNSSCYDGATALADAVWSAQLVKGKNAKKKVLLSGGMLPMYEEVVRTYLWGRGVEICKLELSSGSGQIDLDKLESKLASENFDAFIFRTPNLLGVLEDVGTIASICNDKNVISILSFNPLLSGLFEPPGKLGIDFVTADGQVLGIPMRAGGSSLGIFSTKKEFRRYVPGRLIGKITDSRGNPAYALVFEDREQHVARENAVSNICSNQALNAIRSLIYLSYVGEHGLHDIACLNSQKSTYLSEKLVGIKGVRRARSGHFFNEIAICLPKPAEFVISEMRKQGIFAGKDISNIVGESSILVCVTEVKSRDEIDSFVSALRRISL